jgi:hypothetical protein
VRPHSAHLTHFELPFGVRFQAMHSRFANMMSWVRGGDVTPTGKARASRGTINTIAQNVVRHSTILPRYDIISVLIGYLALQRIRLIRVQEDRPAFAGETYAPQERVLSYFDAASLANIATASCTVVMNCAGKMMVEFFSIEISAIV